MTLVKKLIASAFVLSILAAGIPHNHPDARLDLNGHGCSICKIQKVSTADTPDTVAPSTPALFTQTLEIVPLSLFGSFLSFSPDLPRAPPV